jgi:hypothetical protein
LTITFSARRSTPTASCGANKPSELPVTPVKLEQGINLTTAKALGLDVAALLKQRADEVIE